MPLIDYVSGKVFLNQFVHRLDQNGAVFQIHYWGATPKHYSTLRHKHSFFEMCYVVDGEGIYIDGDNNYSLQENTIFMSRPGVPHQIRSESGIFLLYVAFELIESESTHEWIKIMEDAKHCSDIIVDVNEESVAVMLWKTCLIQAATSRHAYLQEALTSLGSNLITSLLEYFVLISQKQEKNYELELSSPILKHVKSYINDNLSGSLKLTDVAEQFHISSRHLSRLFVTELGVSYSDFVQYERVQKAATLLKITDLSIGDIANESGFSTVHYFTRVFTSIMRHPPGKFRTLYTNVNINEFTDY